MCQQSLQGEGESAHARARERERLQRVEVEPAERETMPEGRRGSERESMPEGRGREREAGGGVGGGGRGSDAVAADDLRGIKVGRKGFQLRSLCAYAAADGGKGGSSRAVTRHFPRGETETNWNLKKPAPNQPAAREALLLSERSKTLRQFCYSYSSSPSAAAEQKERRRHQHQHQHQEEEEEEEEGVGTRRGGSRQQKEEARGEASARGGESMGWEEVAQVLRREKASLLYFDLVDENEEKVRRATTLVIWLVTPDATILAHEKVEVQSILDGPHQQQIERLAQEMEDSLRIYGRAILRKLYNLCISPVEEELRGCRSLIIVPDGPMCLIPWAALMDRRGRYLLESHVLRVLPCLDVIHRIHKFNLDAGGKLKAGSNKSKGGGSRSLAAVVSDPFPISCTFGSGDPEDAELLHADKEVTEAQRVLAERGVEVTMLCREAATRHNTLRAGQGADWLHLAAHVEQSQLLLAQSTNLPDNQMSAGGQQSGSGRAGCEELRVASVEVECTCTYRGDCNRGECRECNASGSCWGCQMGVDVRGGGILNGDEFFKAKAEMQRQKRERAVEREKERAREAREKEESEKKGRKNGENDPQRASDRKISKKTCKRVDLADNGVVLAAEVAEKLRVKPGATVILSACNHTKCSEDMFKLCQGFVAAGAGAVLISMWSLVDESTSALMKRLYWNLRHGQSLPEALRSSMLQLAGRALLPAAEWVDEWDKPETPFCMLPFSRPLHWAGLIVVGQSAGLPGVPLKCLNLPCELDALLPPTVRRQGDYL